MGCCVVCDGAAAGVCAARKDEQRRAAHELLRGVYPTRRFGELDDEACFRRALPASGLERLRRALGAALEAPAFVVAGEDDAADLSDYLYVLCVGREPCLLPVALAADAVGAHPAPPARDLYLRVALSSLGPFAAVQEVEIRLDEEPPTNAAGGDPGPRLRLQTRVRAGVYDEVLLPRYRRLVERLDRAGIRHLDFDVLLEEVAGFDGARYRERFAVEPALLNYLFFPWPAPHRSTEYLE